MGKTWYTNYAVPGCRSPYAHAPGELGLPKRTAQVHVVGGEGAPTRAHHSSWSLELSWTTDRHDKKNHGLKTKGLSRDVQNTSEFPEGFEYSERQRP